MAGDGPSQPKNASTSSENAKDRLAQVSSHIEPNTIKRRRKKGTDGDLPADYSDILGQIATLRKIAATPDANNRGYVRQKQYVQWSMHQVYADVVCRFPGQVNCG
jgi:hypothetical protein